MRLVNAFDDVLPAIDDEYATRYYTHARAMVVLTTEIETLRED
jgi:hypothetical protein